MNESLESDSVDEEELDSDAEVILLFYYNFNYF
jgi:hypothetical protein